MPCFIPGDQWWPVASASPRSFFCWLAHFLLRHTIISGTLKEKHTFFKCKRHMFFLHIRFLFFCTCELFILICRFIAVSNASVDTQKDVFVFEFWPLAARWGSLDLNKISRKKRTTHTCIKRDYLPEEQSGNHWLDAGRDYKSHFFPAHGWPCLTEKQINIATQMGGYCRPNDRCQECTSYPFEAIQHSLGHSMNPMFITAARHRQCLGHPHVYDCAVELRLF